MPYFFVRRKDATGPAPTLLYGYGGFEISQTPWYWASAGKVWLAQGGAYAVANIRGGGEFGPAWHEAALKLNRQRAYDDFIAIAEDMEKRGLTTPHQLGIMGGSNGGLLVGAVTVERPELFGAVVCEVPLLDMIRYVNIGAGASWIAEYGDPAKPDERAAILKYSPYQNVKPRRPLSADLLRHRDIGRPRHPGARAQDGGAHAGAGARCSVLREYRRRARGRGQPQATGRNERTGVHLSGAEIGLGGSPFTRLGHPSGALDADVCATGPPAGQWAKWSARERVGDAAQAMPSVPRSACGRAIFPRRS